LSALVVVHNARYNSFVLVLLHARKVEACNIPANLFALVKERAHMEVTCEGKLASFNLCREYKSILPPKIASVARIKTKSVLDPSETSFN